MTRVGIAGWELKGLARNGSTGLEFDVTHQTNCSYDTGVVHTIAGQGGTYSGKVDAHSGVNSTFVGFNAPTINDKQDGFARISAFNGVWVYFTSFPTTTRRVFVGQSGSTGFANLRINPAGTVAFFIHDALQATSAIALTLNAWHLVEWRASPTTGTQVVLRIDTVDAVSISTAVNSLVTARFGASDTVADTYVCYYDDFASDNADWPNQGVVGALLPNGDNTVTNWTGAGGDTSHLYSDGLQSLPPPGVLHASESNSTNIRTNNTSSPTYIAQLPPYNSLGIIDASAIRQVNTALVLGSSNSSAKVATFELTANPVTAPTTLTTEALAHSTWNQNSPADNGWACLHLTSSAPSVDITLNTFLKIVRTDATSGFACSCFMGILVEWAPSTISTRTVPDSANISITGTRTVPAAANLSTVATARSVPAAANLLTLSTRTVPAKANIGRTAQPQVLFKCIELSVVTLITGTVSC